MKDKLIKVIREVSIADKTYAEYVEAVADKLIAEDYRKIFDDHQRQCACYALGCQMAEDLKIENAFNIFADIDRSFMRILYVIEEGIKKAVIERDEESLKVHRNASLLVETAKRCIDSLKSKYLQSESKRKSPLWTDEMWQDYREKYVEIPGDKRFEAKALSAIINIKESESKNG
jgi:hypothetical protein